MQLTKDKTTLLSNIKKEDGIGLVEVILALAVAMIVITSLVAMAVFTLRSSLQSKLLLQGSKLADEEIERIRAARDTATDWTTFLQYLMACDTNGVVKDQCSINSSLSIGYSYEIISGGTPQQITRYFQVSDPVNNVAIVPSTTTAIRVAVTTAWNIGGQTKYAHVYTDLTNWK